MTKKNDVLDFTTEVPLIERQRRLWAHSEAIELAMTQGIPLPREVSEWLHRTLKNIACGKDANQVLNVVGKRGQRKDGFLSELQHKHEAGFIAAATNKESNKKTAKKAIETISEAMTSKKKSTVRKNYNKLSTERKPTYSLGKK
jgi:spore germination cell wall hydrolase CwlJ-like protein